MQGIVLVLINVCFLAFIAYRFYIMKKAQQDFNYQKLFSGSPYAIYITDKNTLKIIDVNEAMIILYGYTREEFATMSTFDIRPESEHVNVKEFIAEYGEVANKSAKWIHKKKNGDSFHVDVTYHAIPYYKRQVYLAIVMDIDKSIKDGKRISDLLNLYETVNKATNDVIWEYDILSNELKWMAGYEDAYGYKDDMVPKDFWLMKKIHEDDREHIKKSFRSAIDKKEKSWYSQYRLICADGTFKYIADSAYAIFNDEGEPLRMIGAMQDISSQKKYEQQLILKNNSLKEIAWINSHKVRRPLSNILGLVELIKNPNNDKDEILKFVELLTISSRELDNAVITINKQIVEGKINLDQD